MKNDISHARLDGLREAYRDRPVVVEIIEFARDAKNENEALRRLFWVLHLWSDHLHTASLYDNDGEMQCHECNIDFKRADVETIRQLLARKVAAP